MVADPVGCPPGAITARAAGAAGAPSNPYAMMMLGDAMRALFTFWSSTLCVCVCACLCCSAKQIAQEISQWMLLAAEIASTTLDRQQNSTTTTTTKKTAGQVGCGACWMSSLLVLLLLSMAQNHADHFTRAIGG